MTSTIETAAAVAARPGPLALATKILEWGVDGVGPFKSAAAIADQHVAAHGDTESAIDALIRTHTRIVAATGFTTGLGGLATLPVSLPADITAMYAMTARCVAGVAHLRGYDVDSEEVRSLLLITLIGAAGAEILKDVGVQIGQKTALGALRRLPGRVLIEINKKVGFRLLTKFGTKGAINLGRAIPLIGGAVGATTNGAYLRATGGWAKKNFPSLEATA